MDRGTWQATVHGVPRVGHNLATKPPPIPKEINPEYSLEAEAEAPLLWEPDVKSRFTGKDLDVGKD